MSARARGVAAQASSRRDRSARAQAASQRRWRCGQVTLTGLRYSGGGDKIHDADQVKSLSRCLSLPFLLYFLLPFHCLSLSFCCPFTALHCLLLPALSRADVDCDRAGRHRPVEPVPTHCHLLQQPLAGRMERGARSEESGEKRRRRRRGARGGVEDGRGGE